jgi:hypothetical protein
MRQKKTIGVSLPWSIAVGADDTQYRGEDYEPARSGFVSQVSEFRVERGKGSKNGKHAGKIDLRG